MKIQIEIEESALEEARQLFRTNQDFIDMLNRMGRAYRFNDRRYIGCIACTAGNWKRYKDCLSKTRSAFVEEYSQNCVTLVVLHVLPRTELTYEIFQWLFESCLD